MRTIDRRKFLAAMTAGGVFFTEKGAFAQALVLTPSTTEGPYYPDRLPLDQDNDLIIINDSITPSIGTVAWISGRILDRTGSPVRNATVEIWGADNAGNYIHSQGLNRSNPAGRDSNYQGYGRFLTASDGRYLFRVVRPGLYPGRTPHMHLKVAVPSGPTLITQLMIEGEALNANDGILQDVRDPAQRASIIRPWTVIPGSPIGALQTTFDIVLGFTPNEIATPARPVIIPAGGVIHGATLRAGAASGSWITLQGAALAATTRTWRDSDFVNGRLPEALDGVSVRVNNQPAFVSYVSPTQVNALAPDNAADASAQVTVTNSTGTSDPVAVDFRRTLPGFFEFSDQHVAAVRADGAFIAPPGLMQGVTTVAARPGDNILLYGTGFGPTSPAAAPGQPVTAPLTTVNPVKVQIHDKQPVTAFAGLVGAGLYQINIAVPDLPNGDYPVTAEVGGVRTAKFVKLRISR